MKKQILFILVALIHAFTGVEGQTSVQTFGNGVATHTTGASTSFIPNPTGSGTTYARIGSGGGLLSLEPAIIAPPFGSGSVIRGAAATATSVNKISPMVSYTGATQFYTRFDMLLGNSAGGNTGAVDGTWHFFQGEGSTYSDANAFNGAQVFTGLQCVFNAGGTLTVNFRNGAVWTPLGVIN